MTDTGDNDDDIPIDEAAVRLEIAVLKQEHADLDASIAALETMRAPDQLLIARLKRKKLILRDRIARLEDRLTPDIIA